VPDFEIRYFEANGDLAIVRITTLDSLADAEAHAREHQGTHACFEIRKIGDDDGA